MKIPSLILRQLYTFGSLENASGAVPESTRCVSTASPWRSTA
jgi:hypothetical protein